MLQATIQTFSVSGHLFESLLASKISLLRKVWQEDLKHHIIILLIHQSGNRLCTYSGNQSHPFYLTFLSHILKGTDAFEFFKTDF